MRIPFYSILAVAASAVSLNAAEVLPTAVVYDDGSVSQSLTGAAGNVAEGRKIVGNKSLGNCIACHQVTDLAEEPFHGEIGPMLDGAGDRWTEAELRGIVANPKMMFEGTMMPSFYRTDGFVRPGKAYTGKAADDTFAPLLSAQQVEDVVAYLVSLKD